MSAIKVLLVSGSLPPHRCGVGDYTDSLARALQREGVSVSALSSRGVSTDTPYPVAVTTGWSWRDLRSTMTAIRRARPNIVHFQFPALGYGGSGQGASYALWILPSLAKALRLTVVQTWHEYFGRRALLGALGSDALIAVRPNYVPIHLKGVPSRMQPLRWFSNFRFIPNASNIPPVVLTASERSALRSRFTHGDKSLIAYFGLLFQHKGVEDLFDICDPKHHHLVLITAFDKDDAFDRKIRAKIASPPWCGSVSVTGHLPSRQVAELLCVSDAVVLPFKYGSGIWNTSLKAAIAQGTFVLTTSQGLHGYQVSQNTYFAKPGCVDEMRHALAQYIGVRADGPCIEVCDWTDIARSHVALYENLM